jgi:localization factor PodJL
MATRLGETDAARLFEKAARAGFAPAQQRIAAIYEQGLGVPRDLTLAVTWFERAAQAGNVKAMHHLATLLAAGIQGAPDYAGAFRWYSEAADGGLRDSQFNLGVLLTRGVGTSRSLPRAYQWFDLAARQGDADAAAKRDEIGKRLAPPELAAAKLLAERWRARPVDPAANEIPGKGDERTASFDPQSGRKS